MGKKWDAKELITDIQKKHIEASTIALIDGLAILQRRLTSGKTIDGDNPKPYSKGYNKLAGKQRAEIARGERKRRTRTLRLIGIASKVDWLLSGSMRRGLKVLPLIESGKSGARITVTGSNSGISNLELLKYQIGLRPTMWGFSQKSWDAIIKAFKNKLKF